MQEADERAEQPLDPGVSEVTMEELENETRAQRIDTAFANLWEEHLQDACTKAMRDHTGEAGLFEACRRAFREGFHVGTRNAAMD